MSIINNPEGGRFGGKPSNGANTPGSIGAQRWINEVLLKMPGVEGRISSTARGHNASRGYRSVHEEGRAIDLAQVGGMPTHWTYQFCNALINASAELGVDTIIHGNYKWNGRKPGWVSYSGVNHKNHIHLEIAASVAQTPADQMFETWKKVLTKMNISDPFPQNARPNNPAPRGKNGLLQGAYEGGPGKIVKSFALGNVASAGATSGAPAKAADNATKGGSAGDSGLVAEEDLEGMEQYKAYKAIVEGSIVPASVKIVLPEELTTDDSKRLAALQENVDASKTTIQERANQGIAFAGMLGALYTMVLFFTHIFDRTNVFFESKFLKTVSFGRLEAVYDKEDSGLVEGTKTRRVTFMQMTFLAILGMLASILLISGYLQMWIQNLYFLLVNGL